MIKNWYTKHEDKWHQIEDVKDTGIPAHKPGGGNMVKLKGRDEWVHASKLSGMEPKPMEKSEHKDKMKGGLADNKQPSDFDQDQLEIGTKHEMEHTDNRAKAREIAMDHLHEDPKYYIKLKEIEKYDRVDVEADGKKELDWGVEELDKKWNKLRKAVLDSSSSIMSIEDQEYQDNEQDGEQDDEQDDEQDNDDDIDPGAEDEEQVESSKEPADEQGEDESDEQPSPEELEEMLRNEGYSDSEIAHIIHGHIMPEATVDDIKMDAEQAKSEHDLGHKKRMDDLDYDLASNEHETNGLDRDHKQRMLDLEYEYAKKEKDMELKHKEQELGIKLQSQKDKASKAKETTKIRDTDKSRNQDAAKTSKKEREGK